MRSRRAWRGDLAGEKGTGRRRRNRVISGVENGPGEGGVDWRQALYGAGAVLRTS